MKKTFKGFTLVECLVAMAILAIAGTLMAGIYANVASRNNFNTFNNASLSNQMAYIEKYENAATFSIQNNVDNDTATEKTKPRHIKYPSSNNGKTAYVKVKNSTTNLEYSFPVDIYIMYSRDTHNKSSNDTDYSKGVAGSSNNWELVDSGKKDSNGDPIMIWKEKADNNGGRIGNDNENNLRYKYLLGHT